jgi:hypothetical protein
VECTHRFRLYECEKCGGISFVATIERYERDTPGDFHGILRTRCTGCGHAKDALPKVVLGTAPIAPLEYPRCVCDSDTFHVGQCDRWEDWDYFDEGTVVALCATCGVLKALVDID